MDRRGVAQHYEHGHHPPGVKRGEHAQPVAVKARIFRCLCALDRRDGSRANAHSRALKIDANREQLPNACFKAETKGLQHARLQRQ